LDQNKIDDVRIKGIKNLDPPNIVCSEIPVSAEAKNTVLKSRQAIHEILHGQDDRLIVIVGPCSIHDVKAGKEYAEKLKVQADKYKNDLLIVMRVYFEKPRTTIGWKGLINDPHLDQSFNINQGIRLARGLLAWINEAGLPTATEFLDLISPQYVAELISWGAIGARTTESQGHRELASGLSCPIGFKNGTDGNLNIAMDAVKAASRSHHFLSLTKDGKSAVFETAGNHDCHIILRGGQRPNYDKESIESAVEKLNLANQNPNLMIDFSHANSHKDYRRQMDVCSDVAHQISKGNKNIIGIMLESNLVEGRQDLETADKLVYGQSITDACVGFNETEDMLARLSAAVQERRASNSG